MCLIAETPIHILEALHRSTPAQQVPEAGTVESSACGLVCSSSWSSPCTSSTGTGPSSPNPSVRLSPPSPLAQADPGDSPIFRGLPLGSSRRSSVSSMSEIALPDSRVACQCLRSQTLSSPELPVSFSGCPCSVLSSCTNRAERAQSDAAAPVPEAPSFCTTPATSPWGPLHQNVASPLFARHCPCQVEVDMRNPCASESDSEDAPSLRASRLDQGRSGLGSLACLECLVLEVPLPAALLKGLSGRLPRLRHLCVTQLMPNSGLRRQRGSNIFSQTEASADLERIRALESFVQALAPQQLVTLCVSFSCVSTPEKLFEARNQSVRQDRVDGESTDEATEGDLWGELLQRVQKAAEPGPMSLRDSDGWGGRRVAGGSLSSEEDGDVLMELLTEKHHETLKFLWVSYSRVHIGLWFQTSEACERCCMPDDFVR